MGERQVDLPQLFSDVSRTISGISSIMGSAPVNDAEGSASGGGMSSSGGIFGNTCFKACGMEDIQYAARSAGDMLISLRVCIIILTVAIVISVTFLTFAVVYFVCRKAPPSRRMFPLPAFVRDVFPQKDVVHMKDENST